MIGSGWNQVKCQRARLAIQSLDARITDTLPKSQLHTKALASLVAKRSKLSGLIQIALNETNVPLKPDNEFLTAFNRRNRLYFDDCTWFTVPTGQFELTIKIEDTLPQKNWEFVYPLQSRTACKLEFYFDVAESRKDPALKMQLDRENESPVRETLPIEGFVPAGSLRPYTSNGTLILNDFADESFFGKQSEVRIAFGGWQRPLSIKTDAEMEPQVRFTAVISSAN